MINERPPLVSVVISFLNEKDYLHEAINSVLAQEYTNWELLLVDDGSTDESTAIARAAARQYAGKVFYLEHENHKNKGLSASRNKGISVAKGQYVAFLDADDVWLPQKLGVQVKIFLDNPAIAMVMEASCYWSSWADAALPDLQMQVGAPAEEVYDPPTLVNFLYPLSTGPAPCPSGIMVAKEALSRAGGFEESFRYDYALYEDQAFLHKIYLHEKVYVSSHCNNLYRQRPESIVKTVTNSGGYHNARVYFLNWLEHYIKVQGLAYERLNRKLNDALLAYRSPLQYRIQSGLKSLFRTSRKLLKR